MSREERRRHPGAPRAPRPDASPLDEVRRRIGAHDSPRGHQHVALAALAVDDAGPGEAVLHLDAAAQDLVPPAVRTPCGMLTRRPIAEVQSFLAWSGAEGGWLQLATEPPAGHVWVASVARGRRLHVVVAAWPRVGACE